MTGTIFVINPNSSTIVSAAVDRALEPLRLAGGRRIECRLEEGPPGIESRRHVLGW